MNTLLKKIQLLKLSLLLIAVLFQLNNLNAQSGNTVYFQDAVINLPSNINSFSWNQMPTNSRLNNGYVGWLRFNQTPTQDIQDEFKASGLRLLEYYPDKTYLFFFPQAVNTSYLREKGVTSIIPFEQKQKVESRIRLNLIEDWAIEGDRILVTLEYFDFANREQVDNKLAQISNLDIRNDYKNQNTLALAIPLENIADLAALPFVKWIELIPPSAILEDVRGRSIHRSSNLDTQLPMGRNYTGAGIGLLVRDDGIVGEHIDFQGRLSNQAATNGGTHGDGVSGIMTGAGNLNPLNKGMASGSDFYTINAFLEINALSFTDPSTLNLINNGDVQITNNSYGVGCNGGYTSNTRAVDEQVGTNPSVLHVFSAGNSGTSNCGYGAGSGWGNITGGAKQGKNVIATANTFFDGSLASSSSRGPAADGRIKPDITAHGQNQISTGEINTYQTFGGTSGAAPGIAGVSAQLYEAYRNLNGGTFPESALIKAALLNTANDYGNTGPDFSYGWGMVNGLRAAMLIEDGRYLDATIVQGANNNHSITVPANTTQVRFMLYWSDAAAAQGASPALVNDLDIVVTDPSSTTHLPWILNTAPNATLLNSPATVGIDRLNNMEQVLLNNPTAGTYNINIAGFNVPMGPQKYYVVYEIISDELTLTYPIGGERFTSGTQEVIHWDAVNANNSHQLEYSEDNGVTWTAIATLPATTTNYTWTVPSNSTGEGLIRITNGILTDQSSANFSIAPRVTGVNITAVCPTEATVTWNAVVGATSYDVYVLGTKYMEVIGNSTTNSFAIPITDPSSPIWVAVSAKGGNGWASLRSNAVNYAGGGLLNCSLSKDLTVSTINNLVTDFQTICNTGPLVVSADIKNDGTDPQTNFTISYQIGLNPIVQENYTGTLSAGASETINFATPVNLTQNGANTLRVWTSLSGDEFTSNDEKQLDFFAVVSGTELDFDENFESALTLPNSWVLDNPDNARTWVAATGITGSDGNTTKAIYVDGANYNAIGQQDSFTTEYFDLNFMGTPELSFDLAKAQWSSAYNDGLKVEVSTDCGSSYTQIYFKDDLNLATVPYVSSTWFPNNVGEWRTETIDLTPYLGNDILLRFINLNDYSNTTIIDNIRVIKNQTLSLSNTLLDEDISVYPNPSNSRVNISVNTAIGSSIELEMLNSLGQQVFVMPKQNISNNVMTLDVSSFNKGVYFLKLSVGQKVAIRKLIIN